MLFLLPNLLYWFPSNCKSSNVVLIAQIYTLKLYNEDMSLFNVDCTYVENTFEREARIYNEASKVLILLAVPGVWLSYSVC